MENNFGLIQPTAFHKLAPQMMAELNLKIAAPGSSVIVARWDSEEPNSDDGYSLASGTSFRLLLWPGEWHYCNNITTT